ncbi:hypothetical protein CLV51_10914 [Chitinophaga niastensis]|uniref:Uncharacterized protein n=1 Tax=Chitinophaga niastensis TaxID=536980 RepID=A0A2P8HA04_CHINA|nr:hypothetical protein [Chitinophaga niastensis]PSL43020.1 hypothetical protein CLV51_10914 [Chitinophaga niastensis]
MPEQELNQENPSDEKKDQWKGFKLQLLRFNGEIPDPVTGHYLLGSGHRAVNPVLMRFKTSNQDDPINKDNPIKNTSTEKH